MVATVEGDLDVLAHDHDLVAEGLDDPASAGGHQVEGDGLEPGHESGELVVLQLLAQGREADEIGEDHRQSAAAARASRLSASAVT